MGLQNYEKVCSFQLLNPWQFKTAAIGNKHTRPREHHKVKFQVSKAHDFSKRMHVCLTCGLESSTRCSIWTGLACSAHVCVHSAECPLIIRGYPRSSRKASIPGGNVGPSLSPPILPLGNTDQTRSASETSLLVLKSTQHRGELSIEPLQ